MTVIVGVACPAGIALAGDSRMTLVDGQGQVRLGSDHTQKLFLVGDLVIASAGAHYFADQTIAGHMETFALEEGRRAEEAGAEGRTTGERAQALHDFFAARLAREGGAEDAAPDSDLITFLVAGYDGSVGRLKTVGVPVTGVLDAATTEHGGFVVRGVQDIWTRLQYGLDVGRLPADLGAAVDVTSDEIQSMAYFFPCWSYALQDAIDFAECIALTTIEVQRFTHGTLGTLKEGSPAFPTCGGPVDLAVATRSEARWVRRKELRPRRGE